MRINPKKLVQGNFWHELFEYGVFIKGLNGIWETVSGLLTLFLSKATFSKWFYLIARNELLEDPNDKFVNFLARALQNLSNNTKTFAALYILIHGLLNIFLAIQLYRDKHWAYPVTIGIMLIVALYQIQRISINHSLILTAITLLDLLFILLAWHEYKYHQEKLNFSR